MGLEQVHIDIDLCLVQSSEAMTAYRSLVDNALCTYQLDMGRLETEYEQGRSITPAADEDGSDTWSGVFEEDSELEQEEVKDDDSALDLSLDLNASDKTPTTKEEKRLESVSSLVHQLNALSDEEEDVLAKLKPPNNGLTSPEKETLTKKLTEIRANQTMAIVASCKDFNPSYKSVPNKSRNLNLPTIKDLLDVAVNSPRIRRHVRSAAMSRRKLPRSPKKSAPARLTTHYTNKHHDTEINVLTSEDNFDSLGELAVSSGGDNLATPVQINTRRLNRMKPGRRNRASQHQQR